MTDDADLLGQYCNTRSEVAFAELVERHVGLVYHCALRLLGGNSHLAEDVTQVVFVLLAEKACSLLDHPSLAGWLYTTAHFKASEALRGERRRKIREEVAVSMSESGADSISPDKEEQIHAVLDQAVLELHERDREVVLLRFFEGRAYGEIAEQIALSEKAAHKRVERALHRLRRNLVRRGITSSVEALGAILGGQAIGAPSGLAATVTGAAMASPGPAAALSALKLMTMTKMTASILAFVGILAVGLVVRNAAELGRTAKALAISQKESATLTDQYRQLGQKFQALEADLLVSRSTASFSGPATPTALATDGLSAGSGISTRKSSNRAVSVATLNEDPQVHEALGKFIDWENTKFFGPLLAGYGLSPAQIQRAEYLNSQLELFSGYASDPLSYKTDPRSRSEISTELQQTVGSAAVAGLNTFLLNRYVTEGLAGGLYDTDSPLTAVQSSELTQVLVKANSVTHPGTGWYAPEKTDWPAALGHAAQFLSPVQLARLTDLATAKYGYSPQ